MSKTHSHLGEAHLQLAGLRLWVIGLQFPDADDYWDGNWLNIHARVEAAGAAVEFSGPRLRNEELDRFATELETIHRDLRGTAELKCIEPYLSAKVDCESLGHLRVTVEITPDHMTQSHKFIFDIDQSYLPDALDGCWEILRRFPIKGSPA